MTSNKKIKIRLQGHEKFALRDGWLNKGLVNVNEDPKVFQEKEGPDIFGIGNNMVKSLRYWMRAFGLIKENQNTGACLTEIGDLILKNDPYFEDIFTIWVLHSFIAKNIEEATTWYMFFNKIEMEEFEKEEMEAMLCREITKYVMGEKFSEKSVKSDLDVLLNMYSRSKKMTDPEDKNNSPFAQLNLVKNVDGKYVKKHPDRRIISEWNVLYELAYMFEKTESLSIEDVIYGEGGLAKIYQMTAVTANELLDKLDALDYIRVNRTAGLDVIYKIKNITAKDVIKEYYKKIR